jgi:hypothetical protein
MISLHCRQTCSLLVLPDAIKARAAGRSRSATETPEGIIACLIDSSIFQDHAANQQLAVAMANPYRVFPLRM